jgi:dihydrofolate reductase
MTVDGVVDVSDWFVAQGEHDDASLSLFADDASMLLGRKTYEGLAAFWPTQAGCWADRMNTIPKYVASRSRLGALGWNASAVEGEATDGVRELKTRHTGDLVMSGCGELARELIQAGLVDELLFWSTRIVIAAGAESAGQMACRGAFAVAEQLGTTPVTFPSHHGLNAQCCAGWPDTHRA